VVQRVRHVKLLLTEEIDPLYSKNPATGGGSTTLFFFFFFFFFLLLVASVGGLCESFVKVLENHTGCFAHDSVNNFRIIQFSVGNCPESHQKVDVHEQANPVAILFADR